MYSARCNSSSPAVLPTAGKEQGPSGAALGSALSESMSSLVP